MNYKTKQGILFFSVFITMLFVMLYTHQREGAIVFGSCIFMGVLIILFPNAKAREDDEAPADHRNIKPGYLTYYGDELEFAEEDIITALTKHLPYFCCNPGKFWP